MEPENFSVSQLVGDLLGAFGREVSFSISADKEFIEEGILTLDSRKLSTAIPWRPILGYEELVRWTVACEQPSKSSLFVSPTDQVAEFIRKTELFGWPENRAESGQGSKQTSL
jgi:hypothetical protein